MKHWLKRLAGFVLVVFVLSSHAAEYDFILRGGRIVDGTGNPWFHGDVAIKDDRIAAVGAVEGNAKRVIDVSGLVVAPGFIDMHSHSDWVLFEDGAAQSKVRQGVTTEVIGESTSAGPFKGKVKPRPVTVKGTPVAIRTLGDYLSAVERSGISVNVASYVGQGTVWECVMGTSFDRPSPGELQEMKTLVEEAMSDGAFGLSTALMMPPSSLATTADLIELCKTVREKGGIYSTHIRDEGLGVFQSVREAIQIGEHAGLPVDIIHLKIAEEKYWGRMVEVVALIDEARARGVNVQANVYPYTRGNNDLVSIIPPWAHEGGRSNLLARLRDPAQRERVKRGIREGMDGWYNHFTAVGGDWRRMLVSANNPYKGMTMDRVLALRSEGKVPPPDLLDVFLDLLIEQNGSVSTVFAHHTEADMMLALSQPWCSVGSDGSALATAGPLRRGNPHPRSFGTFPRVLGVYAREKKLLRLEEAVRKMTSLNAAKIRLRDRGVLRVGAFADIAVFDEKRIVDRSTYEEPFQHSEGVDCVLVNGQVVFEKGEHSGVRPGRALRHESGAAGRPSKQRVVAEGARPQRLQGEHAGEGPAWHAPSQALYFTGDNRITTLHSNGLASIFRDPSGGANGLLFDREGRLIACEAGNRRVTRTEIDGSVTVLAESFAGKKFNTPNDLAMDARGRVYFTDPRYGSRESMEMRDADGQLVEGVYRIDEPGKVERIIGRELERPNGILVSPDDRYLFVADNNNNTRGGSRKLWRFDLRSNGTVDRQSGKILFDWKTSRGPDGLKMDTWNRLFVAAGVNRPNPYETVEPYPAGIYVLSTEGRQLEFLPVPNDEVTNCAFGGDDLRTLYITAGGTLWSIRVAVPGRVLFNR